MSEFSGQCMCGALRFTVSGPSLWCGHCHCRFCRHAHGAAFVTWVGFPQANVRITAHGDAADDDALRWYHSSKESRRGSCARCGTMMFFESTVAPGETHIARACIAGAIDREPEFHTFFDQKVAWTVVDDELPKMTSEHPALLGYKNVGK
jgi:hypothetical protein